MSRVGCILMFFVSLSLVACASNEKKTPEIKEEFVTNIEKNGLKLFSYTVTMAVPEERAGGMRGGGGMRGSGGRGGGGGGGGMRGGGMLGGGMSGSGMRGDGKGGARPNREAILKRAKEVVYEKLTMKLDETGYCRESYIELDSYFVRGRSQIRGECKDSATDADRMTFINDENA